MSNIDKHAVQAVADLKAGYTLGHADVAILNELARIVLASLEAEPVAWLLSGGGAKNHVSFDSGNAYADPLREVTPLYTAPPAPVSVPDYPEILPCPVMLEPGLRFGKGVTTRTMLGALQRRAGHGAELEVMTPEQRAEHEAGMKEFAAMLQGADQAPVKQPSSNSVLGWLRADYQDDNRGLRGNAPLFVLGKKDPSTVWGLDYIPLTSNSPVVLDGWVACSERMPSPSTGVIVAAPWQSAPGGYAMKWATNCPGHPDADTDGWIIPGASWRPTHWMPLPAAPQ